MTTRFSGVGRLSKPLANFFNPLTNFNPLSTTFLCHTSSMQVCFSKTPVSSNSSFLYQFPAAGKSRSFKPSGSRCLYCSSSSVPSISHSKSSLCFSGSMVSPISSTSISASFFIASSTKYLASSTSSIHSMMTLFTFCIISLYFS